ncbi:MAG: elongation factor G [Oscillospiraceae bacterium]|nr:elongation factor G [Oscillospiraceae bacterium]
MNVYDIKNIRNIAFLGHSGTGKTTLTEAMLYFTKAIDRMGKIEDGTTASDYDQEEKKRAISISSSVLPVEWKNNKINIIDVPGYFDFVGEVLQSYRAMDVAVIVVCGKSGIQVGTDQVWEYVSEKKIPRAFFINKIDRENADFDKVLASLKEAYGISVVPLQYPIGSEENFKGIINIVSHKARIFNKKNNIMEEADVPSNLVNKMEECKQMLIEAVAETDEELLEKYFSEGTLSDEEIYEGLTKGIVNAEIVPVFCGSATTMVGIETLLEEIIEALPSPAQMNGMKGKDSSGNEKIVKFDPSGAPSAFVFKTIVDPFIGKLSMFKVVTGKITSDMNLYNPNNDKTERMGGLFFTRGKQQINTKEVSAGDIGVISKLQYTRTSDTLCTQNNVIMYEEIKFPETSISLAVVPKAKNDEDKISTGLSRLMDEDETFTVSRDKESAETIISGTGETHLEVIASKLKSKFGADVELSVPKIPYRETIKKKSDVQGKHKKQSGGHGQYGDVKIRFEPRTDGETDLLFVDEVVGGVVPRQYIPAVEKGLRECIQKGVLAGYPVIKLKATLYDGSYHPVDSSEMAFKIASSLAFKKGLAEANPVILEPIMHVEVKIPDSYMGDIIGDINKKRGKVLGMEPHGKYQIVSAEVPQAEMLKYATDLRSMTQGRGQFTMKFERYDEVPVQETAKIIESAKKELEEE